MRSSSSVSERALYIVVLLARSVGCRGPIRASARVWHCAGYTGLIGAPDTIRTCDLCLRRATLYPAELRVRGVHLADWRSVGNGLARGPKTAVWVEQGSQGKGHTFESCRGRQKGVCRACRDCG